MPNKTDMNDDESGDEDEQEQDLKATVKAYVIAAYVWLRDALGQSIEEIAPQLRGALSGVSIPHRAWKPLALAGVLLIAAVAMPAVPMDDGTSDIETTEEPVEGTTYEAADQAPTFDGATMNQLPSTFTNAAADAPEPPEQLRASAGSQTMNVETTVVDGEPAIVLDDDRTHDGRWVSIEASWFEKHVGEVPTTAYVDHEQNREYAAPITVRGDSAAFYVREFSTNTVTFDGEVVLSGSEAGDGTQYEYELNDTSGVEDPTINVTGVENTAPGSTSGTFANGDSQPFDVGGGDSPRDETVTLTGNSQTDDRTVSGTTSGTTSESISVGGTEPPANGEVSFTASAPPDPYGISSTYYLYKDRQEINIDPLLFNSPPNKINQIDFNYVRTFDSYEGATNDASGVVVDVYLTKGDATADPLSGTKVATDVEIGTGTDIGDHTVDVSEFDTGTADQVTLGIDFKSDPNGASNPDTEDVYVDSAGDVVLVQTDTSVTVTDDSGSSTTTVAEGGSTTNALDISQSTSSVDFTGDYESLDYDLSWTEESITQDPSATIGGSTVSHSGELSDGQTVTESVDLSTGSNSVDVSTGGHTVDVDASWTEVSQTRNPVVEVNGETTGISGTLADGETTSLDASSSWLQEGTNRVNVSTSSPTSGPASLVGVDYSHGAETTTEATVDETTWSQATNVSNTWPSDRSNATASIPMNDRVVDVRNVEVRYNETSWEPVAESDYQLNGTDLTVQLGDVAAGSTTEIRATGSKVRVTDGEITVLNPTTSSNSLDTRVKVDSAGANFSLAVDETIFADRVHYAENATWGETTGETTITAGAAQTLTLPDATAGAEATVRTWPVEVAPTTGQVVIPDREGSRTEPGIAVNGDGNSEVAYTFVDAKDNTPYVLYSETNGISRDSGMASSPITLYDDNSDETLVFLVDDGSATGTDSGSDASTGGGVAPMEATRGGFTALKGLVPDALTLLLGLVGLAATIVVTRRTGVVDEGTRGAAAVDAGQDVATTAGGLVERLLENELVVGALILGGGAWVLSSGVLSEQATLIVSLAAVPVAMFLVLQQFDRFDVRIWAGSTALVGVFGLQALAPTLAERFVEEAGVIIVVGALLLGWRALSAWRAEANTPDSVTNLEIEATEDDD